MDEVKPVNNRRKKLAIILFSSIAIIGALTIYLYLGYKATHITTDDAFVEGRIHVISSKIPGTIKEIHIKDNVSVHKGDLLLEIDPVDYSIKVEEASSTLNAEESKLSEIDARIEASKKQLLELNARIEIAKANLSLQEANLRQAEIDIKRAENLYRQDALSKERYEKTRTAFDVSLSQVRSASEQLKQTEIALETQRSVIKQLEALRTAQLSEIKRKRALLDIARLNHGYTKIYSPSDGYITKRSVEIGNQIQAGQPLMAVVPLDDIWIVANYKETQLEKVKPGQKVKIKVDTYPGEIFWGKIDSIMAGTGAVFSLFPPENATGNYVKVVQRIPVKILLDKDSDKGHRLRIGMSVVPTIIVEK